MMIINTETLELETVNQIRQATGIPLPRQPLAETLAQLTPPRAYVVEVPPPAGDLIEPAGYEQAEDGQWHLSWVVRDYTDQERAAQLEQARTSAMQRINSAYQDELAHILGDYPDAETKTWDKQEAEARAWQANNTASTPLIDAIAAARSMDKAELVTRIIAKADAWIAASGAATGKRQRLEDSVIIAETVDAANAIDW